MSHPIPGHNYGENEYPGDADSPMPSKEFEKWRKGGMKGEYVKYSKKPYQHKNVESPSKKAFSGNAIENALKNRGKKGHQYKHKPNQIDFK